MGLEWLMARSSKWSGKNLLPLVLALGVVAGGAWAFVELADEVLEGDTAPLDERILLAMRNSADLRQPIGPAWLPEVGRDITALGGVAVLSLIVIAAAGYLLLSGQYRASLFMVVAVAGGLTLSSLLKAMIDRPRPDLISHESAVYTASFPSGHSMMSAVTYLTLAVMLARAQPRHRLKVYLVLIAILLSISVGISRVYVGVHWPTDVLAGWAGGAAWATLCWLIASWLQRRGMVEPEEDEPAPAYNQKRYDHQDGRDDRMTG